MNAILRAIAKRLPAHGRDRAEELLLGRRDFERLEIDGPSALTVICDDGQVRDLDVVRVLERHGVRGVFAVSPQLIGQPGFLSYAQLRAIRDAGHEIAFHGTTHDAFTSFPDVASLSDACIAGVERLRSEGFEVRTLVYPYGRNDRRVRAAAAPLFRCAFTTWFGTNARHANRYAIRRVPFGAYVGKLPGTLAWYRSIIDEAARASAWPALMLHPAGPGHTPSHDEMLSQLLDYARERGLRVKTAEDHIGEFAPAPRLAAAGWAQGKS
jgi:peptidoglycan/xylan/chitin deacetylase (PgdA/CDA1 family)